MPYTEAVRTLIRASLLLLPVLAFAAPSPPPARAIEPVEVAALQKKGAAVVVDVREADERREVVEGARWAATSRLETDEGWSAFVRELPRDKLVVFYCVAGVRSKQAAEHLRQAGRRAAWFDGPDQWRAAGLPLKAGPAADARSPQATPTR